MNKTYAGIGSRETPTEMLEAMSQVANGMSRRGWMLRSGHALGADMAFEESSRRDLREIHLPWRGYNGADPLSDGTFIVPHFSTQVHNIASHFHPAWYRLSDGAKKLMYRNVTIILGAELNNPVNCIVCWTSRGQAIGGTGQALRMAEFYKIPVFNLALMDDEESWRKFEEFIS